MNKITVIIVSYNEKDFLEECINSCLEQIRNFSEAEIIIGDDGSTDGSIDLIEKIKCNNENVISYFVMDRNDGEQVIPSIRVSNVIKKAISMTDSEYIFCISGDDVLYDKTFLLDACEILDKNANLSACVANTFKKFWNDNTEEIVNTKRMNNKLYWMGEYYHLSCYVFRRTTVVSNILDRFCDDTGLEYSIACSGDWQFLDGVKFGYRQRDRSIVHNADEVELNCLEILLLQDCLNDGRLHFQTLSRFYRSVNFLRKNYKKLEANKYQKYLYNSSSYGNDILSMLKKYPSNKLFIDVFIIKALIAHCIARCIYKLIRK